jgi:hypothetical protein
MVELLALYGDDGEEIGTMTYLEDGTPVIFGEDSQEPGSWWSKFRKGVSKAGRLSPQYLAAKKAADILRRKHGKKIHGSDVLYIQGDGAVYVYGDDETMGAFLPGLKKIGKFTSKITTGLARAVGIPQSVLNALSNVDPTKKGSAGAAVAAMLSPSGQTKQVVGVPGFMHKVNWKNIAIIAGAGVGAIVVLKLLVGRPRQA